MYLFDFTNLEQQELTEYPSNILPYAVLTFSTMSAKMNRVPYSVTQPTAGTSQSLHLHQGHQILPTVPQQMTRLQVTQPAVTYAIGRPIQPRPTPVANYTQPLTTVVTVSNNQSLLTGAAAYPPNRNARDVQTIHPGMIQRQPQTAVYTTINTYGTPSGGQTPGLGMVLPTVVTTTQSLNTPTTCSSQSNPVRLITIEPEGTAPHEDPAFSGRVWPWIKTEPVCDSYGDSNYTYSQDLRDKGVGTETAPIVIEPEEENQGSSSLLVELLSTSNQGTRSSSNTSPKVSTLSVNSTGVSTSVISTSRHDGITDSTDTGTEDGELTSDRVAFQRVSFCDYHKCFFRLQPKWEGVG